MINSLSALNARQVEAVDYEGGGVLVLAGAGTGKTRVLTARIVRLLREGVRPQEILAVTFTNKAAREMKNRIEAEVGGMVRQLTLGTFHSICHRLLRVHASAAGLKKDFQILDSQDQLTFIRRLMKAHEIDEKEFSPQDVRYFINGAKERGERAADVIATHPKAKDMLDIYSYYEKASQQEGKLDFSELLLSVLELWQTNEALRVHYAQRFRHILVDELQDTNAQQFKWLALLDSTTNVFFGVGDDDQSIYGFRGAQPMIMQRFQSKLRAEKLIRLEENYRSTQSILSAANHLIANNEKRLGKNLIARSGRGALVPIYIADSDIMEAEEVSGHIRSLIEEGKQPQHIVVLYRTNAQVRLFERKFMEKGIPYRVYGGLRFYDRMEIKHVLAYLRLLVSDDKDALARVINMPPRGIGNKSVEQLFFNDNPFVALAQTTVPKIVAFRILLEDLKQYSHRASLIDTIIAVIEKSGLLAHYEKRHEEERAENLRELANAAAQYEETNDISDDTDSLSAFLSTVALESGGEENEGKQAVNFMTIHAAKGLEYNHVFIVGLEEGIFPHANAIFSANISEVEEERRLMYVALTRAKKTLSLHCSHSRLLYGKPTQNLPSRFLDELPADCLLDSHWKISQRQNTGYTKSTRSYNASAKIIDAPALEPPLPSPTSQVLGVGLRPGDSIRHQRYGTGIVLGKSGTGKEARIDIAFKKAGKKSFKAAFVQLEKL